MKPLRIPFSLLACFAFMAPFVFNGLISSALAFDAIPLVIKERAGVARSSEPVTYGIPLAREDNVLSTGSLQVADHNGQPVDAQFWVLSRYHGPPGDASKPIRMVLLDFQVGAIDANQELIYYLRDTGSGTMGGADLVSEDNDYIRVHTGAMTARISKTNFNLFDQVSVGGQNIISSNAADGIVIIYQGTEYTSNHAPTDVEIEENGPMKAVIKVTGYFKDSGGNPLVPPLGDNGLSYTVRFKVFKNKSYVKVDYTFENENQGWPDVTHLDTNPVHNIWIGSNYIKTTLNNPGNKTVSFKGYTENFDSGNYRILQTENADGSAPEYDWNYTIIKNGTGQVSSGEKYDAYVDLKDTISGDGLMVASRWFWQNHPKGLEVNNNEVRFNVLPDTGEEHRIIGGIWKTTELIYYFHNGTDSVFDDELAALKKRLILKASDQHYAQTGFFSAMVPAQITSDYEFERQEPLQQALDREVLSYKAKFEEGLANAPAYPDTLFALREGRKVEMQASASDPTHYGTWYGWLEFGDFVRGIGYGYSAAHYSWPYISMVKFLRFNDYVTFDLAEELLTHAADISIMHDPLAAQLGPGDPGFDQYDFDYHGAHRWERDALISYDDRGAISRNNPRFGSHFWNRGMIVQYMLTGEQRYLDSVTHSVEHFYNVFIHKWRCGSTADNGGMDQDRCTRADALRAKARGMHAFVSFYKLSGDPKYLDYAFNILQNGILTMERQFNMDCSDPDDPVHDPDGPIYHFIPRSLSSGDVNGASTFQSGVMWEVSIELYDIFMAVGQTARADVIKSVLERQAIWMRDVIYKYWAEAECGTYGIDAHEGEYFPFAQRKEWNLCEAKWASGILDGNDFPVYATDLFAFQYKVTSNQDWLDLARNVFKDYYIYGGSGYQEISFEPVNRLTGFNKSGHAWAKIGQELKKGNVYLKTEWELTSGSTLTAAFTASPNPARINEMITFDASISIGTISEYRWDFDNDGTVDNTSAEPTADHSFDQVGTYTVKLIVSDGTNTAETTRTIAVDAVACVPDCVGKACGDDDGCGGACVVQTCGDGQRCSTEGACVADEADQSADNNGGGNNGDGGGGCFMASCLP